MKKIISALIILTMLCSAVFAVIPASADAPELEGCVAVDAELAEILQAYMDKYTFSGVTNSWTKLCYYDKTVA